jgi:hypothetical protein
MSWHRSEIQQENAENPTPHVAVPDSLASSPLAVALNPSLDEEEIQAAMVNSEEDQAEATS